MTNVPSHLAYDRETDMLYAADTGKARLVRLDTKTGTRGANIVEYDGVKVHSQMDGASLVEVVPPGVFERPSGLALHRRVLFVTDPALGRIFAFDRAGNLLRTLDTGFGDGALGGIVIGPDQKAYVTNITSGEVCVSNRADSSGGGPPADDWLPGRSGQPHRSPKVRLA